MDQKPSLSKTVSRPQKRNAIQSNSSRESSTTKIEAVDTEIHKGNQSSHLNVIGMDNKEAHEKLFIEEEEQTPGFPKTSPYQYKPQLKIMPQKTDGTAEEDRVSQIKTKIQYTDTIIRSAEEEAPDIEEKELKAYSVDMKSESETECKMASKIGAPLGFSPKLDEVIMQNNDHQNPATATETSGYLLASSDVAETKTFECLEMRRDSEDSKNLNVTQMVLSNKAYDINQRPCISEKEQIISGTNEEDVLEATYNNSPSLDKIQQTSVSQGISVKKMTAKEIERKNSQKGKVNIVYNSMNEAIITEKCPNDDSIRPGQIENVGVTATQQREENGKEIGLKNARRTCQHIVKENVEPMNQGKQETHLEEMNVLELHSVEISQSLPESASDKLRIPDVEQCASNEKIIPNITTEGFSLQVADSEVCMTPESEKSSKKVGIDIDDDHKSLLVKDNQLVYNLARTKKKSPSSET